ncbi:MAG: AMP-binding protein [Acidimicrobiales bacterium]
MRTGVNGNLYELLRAQFGGALDQPFLVPTTGEAVSYRDIDDRSARFSGVLRNREVTPGDRVVVQNRKSIDAVALYLACLRAGAVFVPLNTNYVAAEVEFFLDDSGPALFVHEPEQPSYGSDVPATTMNELSAEADNTPPSAAVETRLADDLAAILYTSGTTGRSKGAMLTHANLASNALTLHRIWRFVPGDILLHILPIFHVHGLFVALHTAMLNASTVHFLDRFDVDAALDRLPESTVMMGVPTHYSRLLADPRFTSELAASMRLFTSGSAPMTAQLHRDFTDRTGHAIVERYGMTETGMITSNPYDGDRVPGTVGFPLPAVDVRIVDDHGGVCEPGESGVVEVRGPNVFAGYWRLPEKTEAETHDGWFITGDVGTRDAEGRLTLEGRSSDMVISGGLNVYPREIEALLDEVEGVIESAVVGVPDDDLGEAVIAVIATDSMTDEAPLRHAIDTELARFKHPRRYEFVEELPRNTMGKVQKAVLRTRFA